MSMELPVVPERPRRRHTNHSIGSSVDNEKVANIEENGEPNTTTIPTVPKNRPRRRVTRDLVEGEMIERIDGYSDSNVQTKMNNGMETESLTEVSTGSGEGVSITPDNELCAEEVVMVVGGDLIGESAGHVDEQSNEVSQNGKPHIDTLEIGKIREGDGKTVVEQNRSEDLLIEENKCHEPCDTVTNSTATDKKDTPLVPKKPSSRIAAFQQMLQQQQQQLALTKQAVVSDRPMPDTAKTPLNKPLNGMFGIPGMMGNASQLPPTLAKKLGLTGHDTTTEPVQDENENSFTDLSQKKSVRSRRSRGPQKRLPTKVSNLEKVETKSTFEISVRKTWSISFTPNNQVVEARPSEPSEEEKPETPSIVSSPEESDEQELPERDTTITEQITCDSLEPSDSEMNDSQLGQEVESENNQQNFHQVEDSC